MQQTPGPSEPPVNPLIGRTVNGRYHIVEVIGSGGMATVFRARDERLGRMVALKVLHSQFAADAAFVERFRQEAEFAAGLSAHPNIVSIYDVGEEGNLYYIVMEAIDGRNLKDVIRSESPIPVDRTFQIGSAIASALTFAHQRGLVHRDIKPQNILIASDGTVKVTDFGIAQSAASTQMTRTGMVMGTAHYLSPEQARGSAAEPASDVYSLGVVLFEMLTGQVPFDADNPLAIAMKHVHDQPPPPNRLNPSIPPAAAAIVLRALRKNPGDRYQSANEFGMAMEGANIPGDSQDTVAAPIVAGLAVGQATVPVSQEPAAGGPPTVPPPLPPTRSGGPPDGTNPWRTTMLVLLAIVLVGLSAVGGYAAYKAVTGSSVTPTPTTTPTTTPVARPTPTRTPTPHPTKPHSTPSPTPTPTDTPTKVPPTPSPTPSLPPPTATPTKIPPTATPTATPTPPQILPATPTEIPPTAPKPTATSTAVG